MGSKCYGLRPQSLALMRNEKRSGTTAVQDAGAFHDNSSAARSVLQCASPSAYAARHSAASARRRLALWAQRGKTGESWKGWVRPVRRVVARWHHVSNLFKSRFVDMTATSYWRQ